MTILHRFEAPAAVSDDLIAREIEWAPWRTDDFVFGLRRAGEYVAVAASRRVVLPDRFAIGLEEREEPAEFVRDPDGPWLAGIGFRVAPDLDSSEVERVRRHARERLADELGLAGVVVHVGLDHARLPALAHVQQVESATIEDPALTRLFRVGYSARRIAESIPVVTMVWER